jgi:hypothetical protein
MEDERRIVVVDVDVGEERTKNRTQRKRNKHKCAVIRNRNILPKTIPRNSSLRIAVRLIRLEWCI